MGRRDAVQLVLEVVAEARRILPALQVDFLDGWAGRGNGTSADYEGLLVHHTASASSQARPFPTKDLLVAGRGGANPLSGPLSNFGGPWCTVQAPRLVVVAAHPANHAGASGGRSMGPLPVTKLFNPKVLGLEIDYAGTSAMSAGQLLVAQVLGRAVTNVLGRPSAEWVRAHYETSITGKWDIGYASGKSVDMAQFRAGVWNITTINQEDDMAQADVDAIIKHIEAGTNVRLVQLMERLGPLRIFKIRGTEERYAWTPEGVAQLPPQNPLGYEQLLVALTVGSPAIEIDRGQWDFLGYLTGLIRNDSAHDDALVAKMVAAIPAAQLPAAIGDAKTSVTAFIEQIKQAVNDEDDRRDRDGDPATGLVPAGS